MNPEDFTNEAYQYENSFRFNTYHQGNFVHYFQLTEADTLMEIKQIQSESYE
jgi:hypothetical protein